MRCVPNLVEVLRCPELNESKCEDWRGFTHLYERLVGLESVKLFDEAIDPRRRGSIEEKQAERGLSLYYSSSQPMTP